jgi:hypothetical protein
VSLSYTRLLFDSAVGCATHPATTHIEPQIGHDSRPESIVGHCDIIQICPCYQSVDIEGLNDVELLGTDCSHSTATLAVEVKTLMGTCVRRRHHRIR